MESLGLKGRGRRPDPAFWAGRRILLTGHTGFKGAWAALILARLGATVTGFALPPPAGSNLFTLANIAQYVESLFGDLRHEADIAAAVGRSNPQVVLHMAAQPLVRRSFEAPVETFATNVLGTVNLLEALRNRPDTEAILAVTTDKVYANDETGRAFTEDDRLGGHDPYAASKAATELAVAAYAASFFDARGVALATARGGNVIGGGDFSVDRIVPDLWRALSEGIPLAVRNPDATRPWQHVLDCLTGYLLHVEDLVRKPDQTPRALNFGPDPGAEINVAALVDTMQEALGAAGGWTRDTTPAPREMSRLALDPSRARATLRWRDQLPGKAAIEATAAWYQAFATGADMRIFSLQAVRDYGIG